MHQATRIALYLCTACALGAAACDDGAKRNGDVDAGDDAATDAELDGGVDATYDASTGDAEVDGGIDLSTESACCVGIVDIPADPLRVGYVGLDSGRVLPGPPVNGDVSGGATSAGVVGSTLYLCEDDGEEGHVVSISLSTGAASTLLATCTAVTTDGSRILVLANDGKIRAYANEVALGAGTASATYTLTGLVSRIAATPTELLTSWHATDRIARGAFASTSADVVLQDFDDVVFGLDLLADERLVIVRGTSDGIALFSGATGAHLASVTPAGGAVFQGVACGTGPAYCPAP
ncbi:MAG: hypothetical protein R3A78_08995 [Polyangiales bacterium]|nr:hypothetical protein [Myxococcales bacterium]